LPLAVLVEVDDGLKRLRRNVIFRNQIELFEPHAYLEGFGDTLFIGTAFLAATHAGSLSTAIILPIIIRDLHQVAHPFVQVSFDRHSHS
jgi:hypothetical protein